MNILVTGAGGQLGQELQAVVRAEGTKHTYTFCDRQTLDLTDSSAVASYLASQAIDIVINASAYTAVDRAEQEPAEADAINHLAVAELARLARERGAYLVHISTDYVFSGDRATPYEEEAPTAPLGVYGRTKLLGEQAIIASGVRHLILRTSWLYSAYGANFVKTMCRLQAERSELGVVFDQVGCPTWAGDLARFIHQTIEGGDLPEAGLFHYSNEGVCSWYDLAEAIRDLTGSACRIRPIRSAEYPTLAQRPAYSVFDKSKLKATFGLELPHWRASLAQCLTQITSQANTP